LISRSVNVNCRALEACDFLDCLELGRLSMISVYAYKYKYIYFKHNHVCLLCFTSLIKKRFFCFCFFSVFSPSGHWNYAPFYVFIAGSFAVRCGDHLWSWDHLRSNLGIICGRGSFAVSGSFAALYRFCYETDKVLGAIRTCFVHVLWDFSGFAARKPFSFCREEGEKKFN